MTKKPFALLAALAPMLVSVQSGCAADGDATAEAPGRATAPLNAVSDSLWPMRGGTATIHVCWEPMQMGGETFPLPAYAPDVDAVVAIRKRWVREAAEKEWNGRTVMRFVGWEDCAGPADVHLVPTSSAVMPACLDKRGGYCAEEIGAKIRGKRVFLNVLFGDEIVYNSRYRLAAGNKAVAKNAITYWYAPALCVELGRKAEAAAATANDLAAFQAAHEDCLKLQALHELGHVTGFAHEQYRDDVTDACVEALGGDVDRPMDETAGDLPLGPFDGQSVMSYCRTRTQAVLSPEDVTQTNDVYARLAPREGGDGGAPTSRDGGGDDDDDLGADAGAAKKTGRPSAPPGRGCSM